MSLVPGPPVVVPFSGDRDVRAPMTLGQRNIVQWLSTAPDHRYAWLHWTLDVPVGTGLDDLAGAFSVLVSRHEGLRTVYLGGEAPSQRVIRAGTMAIDVYDAPDGAAHADATAEELLARLGEPSTWEGGEDPVTGEPQLPPRLTLRLPLRVAVAVHGGSVCAGVVRYSHLAVDLHAMAVIGRELTHLLTSTPGRRVTGRSTRPPRSPHQPVDLAAAESAPLARGRHESALRRWEEYLRRMPASLYAAPRTGSGSDSRSGSGAVLLSSTAAALALRHIHSRTRTSQPSIVLAAVCAVLAQRTGCRELHLPLLSSNRFKPELADYVGTLVQATMLVLNLADAGFDTLARRTFAATLEGARLGVYDADRLALTRRQIEHERGIALSMEPVFNNLVLENRPPRPRPVESIDAIASAAARTRLRWQPMPRLSTPLSVELLQVDGAVRLRLGSGDLTRAGRPELEALLLAVERLIVAAAGGDLDCRAVHDVIGLAPLSRGPDWLYLDHTWVDLAEMRRLLAETFAPAVTRVVPTRPAGLVAYLAVADGPVPSPGQAHARCLAGLPGWVAALTPRRYVICAGTPEDPDDPVAWQRLPVLADGSGREVE